jgi:methylenetetrahydrofolate dehydrogenase (NADP+)/methenyltetrahydrofolate cyclohydrolase
MQLLDGKLVSQTLKAEMAANVELLKQDGKKAPHLAAILVGNNAASEVYVRNKVKTCAEIGFDSTLLRFDETISEQNLLDQIEALNDNPDVDGILVQLPLPKHISEDKVINMIAAEKDVDGFHPESQGKMVVGLPTFLPATPYGILLMLEHYKIETAGKHCVVIGRSNIVGTPISLLMSRNTYPGNCTVTICHSRTQNLAEMVKQGDIVIAAIGKPHFITADMIKEGAVVIDVGMNRIDSETTKSGTRLVGDVDFDNVAPKCSYITPVPGGVGVMTICALMKNTYQAATQPKTNLN